MVPGRALVLVLALLVAPVVAATPTAAQVTTTTYLSDLQWTSATNGYGPVERDRSVGGNKANDGGPIKLKTKVYAKGLGTHPRADIKYALNRNYTRFLVDLGIDAVCGGAGSVGYEIHLDGVKVYSRRVIGKDQIQVVSLDTTNKTTLRLVVTDGGDGFNCDHADWAGARLTRTGTPPSSTTTTSTTTTTTLPPPTTSPGAPGPFRFDDVTASVGLGALATAYAHAAAWGDVNADGRPDLFVGTFTQSDRPDGQTPAPNRLFLGTPSGFQSSGQTTLEVSGRASGAVLADLDNDGDPDLVVSNNRVVYPPGNAQQLEPHRLYRNDNGTFVDVSAASGIRVSEYNGRSVGLLDYDGDGRLDLYIVADTLLGSGTRVSRLFRNTGGLVFQDTTAAAGLPTNHSGLGVAVGDANGDSWPDLVTTGGVTQSGAYARTFLFVNNRNGTFRNATTPNLAWTPRTNEDWTAGAAWGDLNRDGRLDLVVGHHFGSAATTPIAPRVYLNGGNDGNGNPVLNELTGAGIAPIAARAPHVEIQDFDNDGRPDLYASVRLGGTAGVYIYRNGGTTGATPTFTSPTSPTIPYYSPGGPTADYDGDGRLDVLLEGLDRAIAPTLLRNTTSATGNWLNVKVALGGNSNGIGARVKIYRAGELGQAGALLGTAEITTGNGFSSAQLPVAHFGLGTATTVDVEVTPPFGGAVITRANVTANQTLVLSG